MKAQFNSVNKIGNRSLLVISSIPLALLISSLFSRAAKEIGEVCAEAISPQVSYRFALTYPFEEKQHKSEGETV